MFNGLAYLPSKQGEQVRILYDAPYSCGMEVQRFECLIVNQEAASSILVRPAIHVA
jgi:hypothetical protein